MQQTCSKCGSVATVPSKFCRNCGGPLAEAQATEAPTRQYGRQTPASEAPPTSSPFTGPGQPPPPSVSDAFTPDTARLHGQQNPPPGGQPYGQRPMPAAYQPGNMTGNPVPYPMQPAPKSNWWKWLLGFALLTLLVCGGLIGYGFKRASDAVPNMQEKINAAIAEAQKEAERAAKEAGVPNAPSVPGVPGAPPPPPAPGGALTIEHLRYPKSEQTTKVNVMGNQVLELKTADNLTNVRAFYEKLLGEPIVESQEQGKKELVFQKVPYVVTIGHDNYDTAKLKINIVRSGWIPKLGDNGQKQ